MSITIPRFGLQGRDNPLFRHRLNSFDNAYMICYSPTQAELLHNTSLNDYQARYVGKTPLSYRISNDGMFNHMLFYHGRSCSFNTAH